MHLTGLNQWMREKAKWFLIGICVVIMVTWLVPWPDLLSKSPGGTGKIFGKKVSPQEVNQVAATISLVTDQRAYSNPRAMYFLLYNFMLDPRSRQDSRKVTAQAWEAILLSEEAQRYGLTAGDEEVSDVLKAWFPAPSGLGYDAAACARLLQNYRLTQDGFESSLKLLQSRADLLRMIQRSVALPENEAWLWYAQDAERVQADYIELRAETFAQLAFPDDDAIKDYYDKNKNTPPEEAPNGAGYLEPEKVSIEYVLCPFARYAGKVVVTQKQVAAYYEEHKKQYVLPPPAEAKPDTPPQYRPLAEVAGAIEKELRQEEAARAVDEEMKEVSEEAWTAAEALPSSEDTGAAEDARAVDLAAIAAKHGLTDVKTPLFSAEQSDSIIPGARELATRAFGQSTSTLGRPGATLTATDGEFIFQLLKIQPPRPTPLEAIRDKVRKDYCLEKGFDMAQEIAGETLNEKLPNLTAAEARVRAAIEQRLKPILEAKKDVKKDPKAYYERGQTSYFSRSQTYGPMRFQYSTGLPGNYNYANFADKAFALKDREVDMDLEPSDARAVFLLERVGVKPASRADFEKNKADITKRVLERKQGAAIQTWFADVRHRAKPSPEVLRSLAALPQWSGTAQ